MLNSGKDLAASGKIDQIIDVLKAEFPESKHRSAKSDPLDMLIATMLSQNTTDKTSYRAFMNLKNDFKDWNDVMNAPLSKIRKAIRVCGLSEQKSKNIKALLKKLYGKYGKLSLAYIRKKSDAEIYDELLEYKGIGMKTISCVLAFSLSRDVFPVDTHVHRVANRLGIANAKTPEKTFSGLSPLIPNGKRALFHSQLIRFGRKICRAAGPLCSKCILYDLCVFKEKEYYAGIAQKTSAAPKENNFIILEHV